MSGSAYLLLFRKKAAMIPIYSQSKLTERFNFGGAVTHPYATKIKIYNFCQTRMCQDTAHAFTPSHSQTHNT